MVTPSSPAPALPEYEAVVSDLVEELRRYKNAVTHLNDATEANRGLQARSEALGKMMLSVAERAEIVLSEIKQMDAPIVSSRLSTIEGTISEFSQALNELKTILSATETTLVSAVQATNDAIEATQTSKDQITEADRGATEAANAAQAASETSQRTMASEVQAAFSAARDAKASSDASVEAIGAAVPKVVSGIVAPLSPKFDRLALLLYVLITEVLLGFIVLLVFR